MSTASSSSFTRVAVITGAGSGIGLNFARKLYQRNDFSHIILAVRNEKRGHETIEAIKKDNVSSSSSTTTSNLIAVPCDQNSLASVASFCKQVSTLVNRIDLLVLNAGTLSGNAFDKTSIATVDGLESVFGVNHVSHFAMFQSLVPLLLNVTPETISSATVPPFRILFHG